ncbi:MAG: hypothetical protein Q7J54_08085 [Candidatus Woesearchaeota archaeon]|nr:hypothetical protein [Candidatus Woesearchaeota archaeon]
MHDIQLMEKLFDPKILAVLKLFVENKEKQLYLREISKAAKVPVASCFRIMKHLLSLNLVKEVNVSRFRLYQLNENDDTKFIEGFIKIEKHVLDLFVDEIKKIEGISSIILHGEDKKDKANILLIGANINSDGIKAICTDIREKYSFTITYLILTQEQYAQMSDMNLFPREKKIIYSR